MRGPTKLAAAAIAVTLATTSVAAAQCPDGTPPPCATAVVAVRRTADPPLDAKTWIVVPFENVARAADVEWIRAASVNLLYLDLSRWQDIRVIDDERVADYMRNVPAARAPGALSLNAALAVARRAGAGRLVMGDLLKIGPRLAIVAKVFDVRTSQRIRSPKEETTAPDSIMPLFSRLARGILAVEPPPGATLGEVGTSRIAAYQEYLEGAKLLNEFDLEGAALRFRKAIAADSTFALAHFKLASALLWRSGGDTIGARHARTAVRYIAKLPARERALIRGFSYFPSAEYDKMCAEYAPLVKADSSDVDAVGGLADCLYHDIAVIPDAPDSTRGAFRGRVAESIRLYRMALKIDPTYLLGYQHIIDAYLSGARVSTRTVTSPVQPGFIWFAPFFRTGDSLVADAYLVRGTSSWRDSLSSMDAFRRSYLANLALADQLAREWVTASPNESRARFMAAQVALVRGDLAPARVHLAAIRGDGGINPRDVGSLPYMRIEALIRSWDIAGVTAYFDSLWAATPTRLRESLSPFAVGFGRSVAFDSAFILAPNVPPPVQRYRLITRRLATGESTDSLELQAAESALVAWTESRTPGAGLRAIRRSLTLEFRYPRSDWLRLDSLPADLMLRPAAAVAHKDTARLRAAARSLDSLSSVAVRWQIGDSAVFLMAADAHLILRDSSAALQSLRRGLDSVFTRATLGSGTPAAGLNTAFFIPRAMLLRADLAAALGQRAEALLWYRRLSVIWQNADPPLASLRDRVRRAIDALSASDDA